MAEASVLKLKVDSQEYDAKIKRASEGLRAMEQACRNVGGTFEVVEKEELAFVQALGKMETVSKNTKGQLRELTQSLTDMTAMYRGLSDAEKNSDFGRALNQSIRELTERAGNAKDAMMDVQASIKNAASDTRLFDQLAGGASLVTSGFQTLQGATKILGVDLGDNVEVLAKLQAAMAVTNGLTTIQTALQKQSALMQGVQTAQTALATAAQTAFAAATGSATVAQAAFNVVANANPYVLLASAVAALIGGIKLFSTATKTATEDQKKMTEELKKYRDTVANSYAAMAAKYKMLQSEWMNLKTAHEKNEWITANKSNFAKLGTSIKDVSDAENVFVKNTEKMMQAFRYRAEAAALQKKLEDLYAERLKRIDMAGVGNTFIRAGAPVLNTNGLTSGVDYITDNGGRFYTEAGAAKARSNNSSNSTASIDKQIESVASQMVSLESKAASILSGSGSNYGNGHSGGSSGGHSGSGGGNTTTERPDIYASDSIRAQQKLVEELTDKWNRASAAERDGYKKQLDEATAKLQEMQGKVKEVKEKTVEWLTGAGGLNADAFSAYISMLKESLDKADIGSALYESLSSNMSDAKMLQALLEKAFNEGIDLSGVDTEGLWSQILNAEDIPDSTWQQIADIINKQLKDNPIALNFKAGTIGKPESAEDKKGKYEETGAVGFAQDIHSGLSGISSSLQAFGLSQDNGFSKLIDKMGAVITIITSIQTIVSAIEAIDTISTLIPFARGGMVHAAGGYRVPGNMMSGDRVPAMLNSGELVLNKAQQGNLASQLQGNYNAQASSPYVSGEQIFLGLNNYLRRSGRGEIITSR